MHSIKMPGTSSFPIFYPLFSSTSSTPRYFMVIDVFEKSFFKYPYNL
jgi:hypothetical protein